MKPRLSVVVASRNDDHGGDMLARMQAFVRGLDHQSQRHAMGIELVFVEWNPPLDRPLLHAVLPCPTDGSPLRIRYVMVPGTIHRRWRHHERMPLFQMIAKNVGIRRSRGDFVLCTNVDLLFSDALCNFLADGQFADDVMYRANRCDIPRDVLNIENIDEQLTYAQDNVIRRLGEVPWGYGKRFATLRRFKHRIAEWICPSRRSVLQMTDTEACGDFTLMSRKSWDQIRGYPELGLYSIHVDSLGCLAALACGCRQVVLPPELCTYHMEHDTGWMSMTPAVKMRFTEERPSLDWMVVCEAASWMLKHHAPLDVNDDNWGCAGDVFEEMLVDGSC